MSGKYDSESYNVTLFDRRGAKIAKHPLGNVGLIASKAFGCEQISQGNAHSFVVERVAYNSLDRAEAWLPKAAGRYSDGKPYGENS